MCLKLGSRMTSVLEVLIGISSATFIEISIDMFIDMKEEVRR